MQRRFVVPPAWRVGLPGAGGSPRSSTEGVTDPVPEPITEPITGLITGPITDPVTEAAVLLVREPALAGTGVEMWLAEGTAQGAAPPPAELPAGGLDPADADVDLPWRGAPPDGWGRHLGLPDEAAVALLAAAVREVYVATGVLLAELDEEVERPALPGAPAAPLVVPVAEEEERAERAALAAGRLSTASVLHGRGLALRSDRLRPWTRWLTPEALADRRDTWTFLAAVPTGARTRPGPGGGRWWRPAEVLDAEAVGRLSLSPQVRVTVEEAAAAPDLAGLLGTRRSLEPVLPLLVAGSSGTSVVADLPEHPDPVGLV